MRFRFFLFLLCALLAAPLCLAQETPANFPAPEDVIPPAHQPPEYVEWLLEIARNEIGYTEDSAGVTKYGLWTGDPSAEWCAEFLCWCVDQVDQQHDTSLLHNVFPYYTGTNVGRDWFIKQGRYIARTGNIPGWGSQWLQGEETGIAKNSYIPLPGDWMFFSTNSLGDTTHVALVEYCSYDEEGHVLVHVIEGNNPSAVARNTYPLNNWAILGYGTVYDLADVVLRFGNQGAKVLALQEELVAAGLMEAQYTTGKYGAITTQAIKDFQKMMQLHPSGVANHETQLLLHDYVVQLSKETPENWIVEDDSALKNAH